jgi:cytochrome c oxidase accessory protein FixG
MEMVFRKVEYFIEGDANQQRLLDRAPWNAEKVRKKFSKHGIFFILSFLIANTLLAYLIGIDRLRLLVVDGPFAHAGSFSSLVVFTGVFYGVYARFREQACLVVCPYGRLQGVLLDRNSVVIAYDYKRGETRGKFHREAPRTEGDCIDCHQCVEVCPTGIDIRNGTQLECVNCTACIDACDRVMDKVGFSKGLIRYASEENIATKNPFRFTTRIISYSVLLGLLLTTLVAFLAMRSDLEVTLLRVPGQMYQQVDSLHVSNLYNIQVANKTFRDMPVRLDFAENSVKGEIRFVGNNLEKVHKDSLAEAVLFIVLPSGQLSGLKTPITLSVISEGREVGRVRTNFMGPSVH